LGEKGKKRGSFQGKKRGSFILSCPSLILFRTDTAKWRLVMVPH
jgi:hypothetical protein